MIRDGAKTQVGNRGLRLLGILALWVVVLCFYAGFTIVMVRLSRTLPPLADALPLPSALSTDPAQTNG